MPLLTTEKKKPVGVKQVLVKEDLAEFELPYRARLNFAPLLKDWKKRLMSEDPSERGMASIILERAKKVSALWEPIDDPALLLQYPEIVSSLLAGLFPLSLRNQQLAQASPPFSFSPFYMTPALESILEAGCKSMRIEASGHLDMSTMHLKVCAMILRQCYGVEVNVEPTVILTLESEATGLLKHYKMETNTQFVEVVPVKPLKQLPTSQIEKLLCNIYDKQEWLTALPPDAFEIHGIVGIQLVDLTKEESISRLRQQLLKKDALTSHESIRRIEVLLRNYFQMPELRFGIMAVDFPVRKDMEESRYNIRHCLLDEWAHCRLWEQSTQSVYAKVAHYGHNVLLENLEWLNNPSEAEKALMEKGVKSLLVIPLKGQNDQLIGMVELASSKALAINSFTELQFQDLLPLFHTSLERSREEIDNRIEAIMREHFTAIHPSVEWRFIDAAYQIMKQIELGVEARTLPQIVLEKVFPMYAQADIVSSSLTRNQAIRKDFTINLQLLEQLLLIAIEKLDYPLLEQYLYETRRRLNLLQDELQANDEQQLMEFLLQEVNPMLAEVAHNHSSLADAFAKYESQLEPGLGIVYQHRKAFEQSVKTINNRITEIVERAQEIAQEIVPHYFEKYQTDGVQFELYAGQSILRKGTFTDFQLRNLRLRQLLTLVEITQAMQTLSPQLPTPLQTAQLAFVYGQPISIRFRPEEKRFDVEGAYNIRYEIIKKRIDKATVTLPDGRQERLTQAGKIAIVYTSDLNKREYLGYIDFLRMKNLIEGDVEHLDLDQLQGVKGLKAIRFQVKHVRRDA